MALAKHGCVWRLPDEQLTQDHLIAPVHQVWNSLTTDKMLQGLTRNQKLLLGAAAAGLGIYVINRRSVSTAPVPVPVQRPVVPSGSSAGYASSGSAGYPQANAGYSQVPTGSGGVDSHSRYLDAQAAAAGENRTIGEKVSNAADVIGTHATAAKDDLKRLGSEVSSSLLRSS